MSKIGLIIEELNSDRVDEGVLDTLGKVIKNFSESDKNTQQSSDMRTTYVTVYDECGKTLFKESPAEDLERRISKYSNCRILKWDAYFNRVNLIVETEPIRTVTITVRDFDIKDGHNISDVEVDFVRKGIKIIKSDTSHKYEVKFTVKGEVKKIIEVVRRHFDEYEDERTFYEKVFNNRVI